MERGGGDVKGGERGGKSREVAQIQPATGKLANFNKVKNHNTLSQKRTAEENDFMGLSAGLFDFTV